MSGCGVSKVSDKVPGGQQSTYLTKEDATMITKKEVTENVIKPLVDIGAKDNYDREKSILELQSVIRYLDSNNLVILPTVVDSKYGYPSNININADTTDKSVIEINKFYIDLNQWVECFRTNEYYSPYKFVEKYFDHFYNNADGTYEYSFNSRGMDNVHYGYVPINEIADKVRDKYINERWKK